MFTTKFNDLPIKLFLGWFVPLLLSLAGYDMIYTQEMATNASFAEFGLWLLFLAFVCFVAISNLWIFALYFDRKGLYLLAGLLWPSTAFISLYSISEGMFLLKIGISIFITAVIILLNIKYIKNNASKT